MLERARQLRCDMTLPERLLWREVRGRGLGPRFRRQVPIGPYIVDLYCPQAKLVAEVDGDFHGDRMIENRDRALWLDAQGYRVVRFAAVDVMVDLEAVVERGCLFFSSPLRSAAGPPPPPGGRGIDGPYVEAARRLIAAATVLMSRSSLAATDTAPDSVS